MPTIEVTCKIPSQHYLLEQSWGLDELLMQIVETGALGTTQSLENQFEVYIESADIDSAIKEIKRIINDELIEVTAKIIPEQNWTQTSRDLLEPIKSGQITIIPVTTSLESSNYEFNSNQILIIPGMGFGTGHHATTKTIIESLQQSNIKELITNFNPLRVADFGTGSGLLAIVIARLFQTTSYIYAFDNDPAAIANACENAEINTVASHIDFKVADHLDGQFNLVTANIYAEVLCNCYEQFINSVVPGGILILSGIMEQKLEMIQKKFVDASWDWLDTKIIDNWATITLIKRN